MIYVLLIILIIAIIVIIVKFRKPKKSVIQLYSGANGTGKSFNMTEDSRMQYKKNLRKWKAINKPNWTHLSFYLDIIPYFKKKRLKKEIYGLKPPMFLSTYPIKIKKGVYSQPLTNEYMFEEISAPLNSVFVIDEFSSWISQFEYNEKFSPTLNDFLQKFRHYLGNDARLYIADQCTNNIPIQVRYRANQAIVCKKTTHYFKLFHFTHYKCIDLTDDIKSVEIVENDNADTEDKVLKIFRFGRCRNYDDRAYSNRYFYVDGNIQHSKKIDSPLKVDITLKKPSKSKDKNYVNLDDNIEKINQTKIG